MNLLAKVIFSAAAKNDTDTLSVILFLLSQTKTATCGGITVQYYIEMIERLLNNKLPKDFNLTEVE